MRPAPKCVIDRSRACGGCLAPSPQECPYAFLLDPEELAGVVAANARSRREDSPPAGRAEAE